MSEKKRVRVYRPEVNTDHFANYMFQVGGPVGQGPMPAMQQQDISNDIADLLQMYAQAKGLGQEELEQMYTAIMQMEPDQQQQTIAQMQQELGSQMAGNPMIAKAGGYIKQTKKLLSKKIGGISTNTTSKDLVEQRLESFKNNIGNKVMNAALDEVTEQQSAKINDKIGNASQNFAMSQMPTKDYGGYVNDFSNMGTGIASGSENVFRQDVADVNQQFKDDFGTFMNQLGRTRLHAGPIKVKKSGFLRDQNPAQVSTQPPSASSNANLTSNELASQMFGLKNGGKIPSYENAGTIDIGTGKYDPVTKTITGTDGTTRVVDQDEANWIMSQMSFGQPSSTNNTTTDQTSNTGTNAGTGINGWQGGFYWQNGVPVSSVWQQQAMQQMQGQQANNFASIFQSPDRKMRIQGNLLDMARNPAMVKQFGQALTQFQPDNVYLSKAKGRVNPFGAKVVLKWDYDENGRPVQKEVVEGEQDASGSNRGTGSNFMGRMFRNSKAYENVLQRRGEKGYEKFYGHSPEESAPNLTSSTSSTTTYAPPAGPTTGASTISNIATHGQTGNYSDVTNPNFYKNETGNTPFVPINSNEIPVIPGFAYGGIPKAAAGKLVMKQQFRPYGADLARLYSPGATALSSMLNMQGLNEEEEQAYNIHSYFPSIPMGLGSMGTDGTASLTGKQIPNLKPLNEGLATYQNEPTFGIAPNFGNQGYNRRNGGMYQEGGVADYQEGGIYNISDDELDQIFKKGGKVQYY